jgi:hypothetical protein
VGVAPRLALVSALHQLARSSGAAAEPAQAAGLALWRRSRAGAGGVVAEASLPVAEAARLWSRVASTTPQSN